MSSVEARSILNLENVELSKEKIEEVRQILLKQNDPTAGGSQYLVSKVNDAAEVLVSVLTTGIKPEDVAQQKAEAQQQTKQSESEGSQSTESQSQSEEGKRTKIYIMIRCQS